MPSEVTDSAWLHAKRNAGTYPRSTENCGKWLVFVSASKIDEEWGKIKSATEEGRLGSSSKVATAARNSKSKVICIYTYDWTDKEDVMQIRQELRQLGVTSKISYKADEDTHAGKYSRYNIRLSLHDNRNKVL